MTKKPITFDDFVPGREIGSTDVTYSDDLSARWQRIFGSAPEGGAGGAAEGAGLAVVMMMRAFLTIVSPRPPGNVHARQQLSLQQLPHAGEVVRSVVTCVNKEMRRERRYVELQAVGVGEGGRPIYSGRLTLIWAA